MNANNSLLKRSVGREYAFKFIYKHLLTQFKGEKNEILSDSNSFEKALDLFNKSYYEEDIEHTDNNLDLETTSFARNIIKGSLQNETKNSQLILKYLANKNLEKIDPMNLAVLLLGCYEILNDQTSKSNIYINEYVNIAKKYCPNDAQGFINSILDNIAKDYAKL